MAFNFEGLHNLPPEKYLEGANLSLKNSEELIKAAKLLATELKSYPIATSLMVLGLEELAKASNLKLKSINPEIDITDLKKIFRVHSVKHDSLFIFFGTCSTYWQGDEEFDKMPEKVRLTFIGLIIILILLFNLILNKPTKLSNVNGLSFDEIKQRGFYVDYNGKNKDWFFPGSLIGKEEYESFAIQAELLFSVIKDFIFSDYLNSENVNDFIERLEKVKNEGL